MNPDDAAADAKQPEVQPPASGDEQGPQTAASPGSSDADAAAAEPTPHDASDSSGSQQQGTAIASPAPASHEGADTEPQDGASAHDEAAPHQGVPSQIPVRGQPTFLLFGVVSSVSLLLDVISKGWAEVSLTNRPTHPITLIEDHLSLTLAYNPGGAWGLLTNQPEDIRKPFFVFVSVAAILFIVSLYGRLAPGQRALTWGLPLVLGGALGNLADRITRSKVIDFIDYRADWVKSMNEMIARYFSDWSVTDHWPTFNVADIAICVGVGLMAVDMIASRRGPHHPHDRMPENAEPPPPAPQTPAPEGPSAA